jgi:hypothetical protein
LGSYFAHFIFLSHFSSLLLWCFIAIKIFISFFPSHYLFLFFFLLWCFF